MTLQGALAVHLDPDLAVRDRIDFIDSTITYLLERRRKLSIQVQAERVRIGGSRLDLAREKAVHAHYRDALGVAGSEVSWAVLHLCRGEAGEPL